MMGLCHCRECQRSGGSAYVPWLGQPKVAVKIRGEVRYHDYRADSGNTASHGFCPQCGSQLLGRSSGYPDMTMLRAASLDDPGWYRPTMDVYTASAQPWDYMDPALPKFPGIPSM
jgi:hypothetical protein